MDFRSLSTGGWHPLAQTGRVRVADDGLGIPLDLQFELAICGPLFGLVALDPIDPDISITRIFNWQTGFDVSPFIILFQTVFRTDSYLRPRRNGYVGLNRSRRKSW